MNKLELLQSLLANDNLDQDALNSIVTMIKDDPSLVPLLRARTYNNYRVKMLLIEQSNNLATFSNDPDDSIREAVAKQKYNLCKMSRDKSPQVRCMALASGYRPVDDLCHDGSPEVQQMINYIKADQVARTVTLTQCEIDMMIDYLNDKIGKYYIHPLLDKQKLAEKLKNEN